MLNVKQVLVVGGPVPAVDKHQENLQGIRTLDQWRQKDEADAADLKRDNKTCTQLGKKYPAFMEFKISKPC
jgi:hypothetical protein